MKKLIVVPAIFISYLLFAQKENQVVIKEDKPFIEVTGTAENELMPDKIFITITLKSKTINKEPYSIDQQQEKLIQSLQHLQLDVKNLSLSASSKELILYKRKEVGVEEKKEFILMVSNAAEVAKLFKALNQINIKEAFISSVDHSQIETIRKEVRIAAVKAAKEKATYLLTALGETPGRPLEITEVNTNNFFRPNFLSNTAANNNVAEPFQQDAENIDFEKMIVKFSYFIKYSINEK